MRGFIGGIRNGAKVMAQSDASKVAWDDNDMKTRALFRECAIEDIYRKMPIEEGYVGEGYGGVSVA